MASYICNDVPGMNVVWVLPGFILSNGLMVIDNFRGTTIKEVQFSMMYPV